VVSKTLGEVASYIEGDLVGPSELLVRRVMDLAAASDGDITFVATAKMRQAIAKTKATAVIVPQEITEAERPLIRVRDPYLAVARLQGLLLKKTFEATGVSPKVIIGEGCSIPAEVSIHPSVVIGKRVRLGERVTLLPTCCDRRRSRDRTGFGFS